MDAMGALGLGIVLSLRDNASSMMDKIQKKLTGLKGASKEMIESFTAGSKSLLMGAGVMAVGAMILTTAFSGPIEAAIRFESVMADVNKVANFTTAEYNEMSGALVAMSKNIPIAASGLGEIMAAAAQAGIAKEDLVAFTEDAAKMGVAFDISAQEAGDAMAGLRSIFQIGQKDVVLLGDAVNHLANNMNATAPSLLAFLNRAGSVGKTVGMSSTDIAALGATFIDLKTPPEVAARAFSSLAMTLTTASKSTKDAEAAYKNLGFTGAEMEKMFREDATGAIMTFLEAVKKSSNPIGNLKALVGQGFADDIAKLSDGTDKLRAALGLVGSEAQYAGSMLEEYEVRSKTVENALQLLTNRIEAIKLRIGNVLLPIFGGMINAVSTFIDKLSELPTPVYAVISGIVGLSGAALVVSGALIAFGGLIKILPIALMLAKSAVGGLRTALIMARGTFLSAALPILALIALGSALRFAWRNNIGGIQDAAMALKEGFKMAANAGEDGITQVDSAVANKLKEMGIWDHALKAARVFYRIRVFVRSFVDSFKTTLKEMKDAVSPVFGPMLSKGREFLEFLGFLDEGAQSNVDSWAHMGVQFGKVAAAALPFLFAAKGILSAVRTVKEVGALIAPVVSSLGTLKTAISSVWVLAAAHPFIAIAIVLAAVIGLMIYHWDTFGGFLTDLFGGIWGIVSGVFGMIVGLVKVVAGLVLFDFDLIGEGITGIFKGLEGVIEGFANTAMALINGVKGAVTWVLEKIGLVKKDQGSILSQHIDNLDASDGTKAALKARVMNIDPDVAERVVAQMGADSFTDEARRNPKIMEAILNSEGVSPTAAPLAETSAAAKTVGMNGKTEVDVQVESTPVIFNMDGRVMAEGVAKYNTKQESRRGGTAWGSELRYQVP